MDVEVVGKVLRISHKLKRGEYYSIREEKRFKTISIYKKPVTVRGISSSCEDGAHVIFIDFDSVVKWLVLEDAKRIQDKYNLPPFYLFATKEEKIDGSVVGNYHLINLCKVNSTQAHDIISETHCDNNYIDMVRRNKYRNWVLRMSNKGKRNRPKFLQIVGELKNLDREISKPHLDFLEKAYKIPKIKYLNSDKCKKVFVQTYQTLNA